MIKPLFIIVLAGALLAACGATKPPTPEPIIRTVEIRVPVPVQCQGEIGPEPVYVDSDEALAAAPNIFEAMKLRIVGRLQRIDRERELMAARCQP